MKTDKFTLFVYCNFLVLLSITVWCSQNINKQIANISDETLTDYSFLSRYHYTKSKNYLKRRYRIRHFVNSHVYRDTLYYNISVSCYSNCHIRCNLKKPWWVNVDITTVKLKDKNNFRRILNLKNYSFYIKKLDFQHYAL